MLPALLATALALASAPEWTLSEPTLAWSRSGRTWTPGDARLRLEDWQRYTIRRPTPKWRTGDGTPPTPERDTLREWRPRPALLDTARPFLLPGAGSLVWTGRFFWTGPDSLWACARLGKDPWNAVPVEVLLPPGADEHPGALRDFRPRRLRIVLDGPLPLGRGQLRPMRRLLLEGPPEATVPVPLDAGGDDSPAPEASTLLLQDGPAGPAPVDTVAWLPRLRIAGGARICRILSHQDGIAFAVDPVEPRLDRLPPREPVDRIASPGAPGREPRKALSERKNGAIPFGIRKSRRTVPSPRGAPLAARAKLETAKPRRCQLHNPETTLKGSPSKWKPLLQRRSLQGFISDRRAGGGLAPIAVGRKPGTLPPVCFRHLQQKLAPPPDQGYRSALKRKESPWPTPRISSNC